jgi:hypothetical protein
MERPDHLYDFICTICNRTFDQLPPDAREVSHVASSRTTIYLFADGVIHALKKRRKKS